jgi:cystathionine beta-lyase/cystathionine gamma-synthase
MFYDLAVNTWGRGKSTPFNVIASNRFTTGPYVAAFEDALAAYHQRQYCVMVNSGSSANLLAVAALFYKGIGPCSGDEVIVRDLVGHDVSPPAAIRPQAQDRRHRNRHYQRRCKQFDKRWVARAPSWA